jgi:hypothetical protein
VSIIVPSKSKIIALIIYIYLPSNYSKNLKLNITVTLSDMLFKETAGKQGSYVKKYNI